MRSLVFLLLLLAARTTFSQSPTDSTQALFKGVTYSYMQWDFGYTGVQAKGQTINTFDATLLGVVFNKKWFTSIGFMGWTKHGNTIYLTEKPPVLDSYFSMYLQNEWLSNPDKLVNFSFPIRIGWTGVTGWDTLPPTSTQMVSNWNFTGVNYYQHSGDFWTASLGANVFLNLFKPLSLGAGAAYTIPFNTPKIMGSDEDFSGMEFRVFLRFKYDTRAMMKKTLERQQEFLKQVK